MTVYRIDAFGDKIKIKIFLYFFRKIEGYDLYLSGQLYDSVIRINNTLNKEEFDYQLKDFLINKYYGLL